jgi:hypothetical protein
MVWSVYFGAAAATGTNGLRIEMLIDAVRRACPHPRRHRQFWVPLQRGDTYAGYSMVRDSSPRDGLGRLEPAVPARLQLVIPITFALSASTRRCLGWSEGRNLVVEKPKGPEMAFAPCSALS